VVEGDVALQQLLYLRHRAEWGRRMLWWGRRDCIESRLPHGPDARQIEPGNPLDFLGNLVVIQR
jgi:hypothetical protein